MGEDSRVSDPDKQHGEHRVSPEMQQLAVSLRTEGLPELVELVRQPTTYSPEIVTHAYETHQRELFGFAGRAGRVVIVGWYEDGLDAAAFVWTAPLPAD